MKLRSSRIYTLNNGKWSFLMQYVQNKKLDTVIFSEFIIQSQYRESQSQHFIQVNQDKTFK